MSQSNGTENGAVAALTRLHRALGIQLALFDVYEHYVETSGPTLLATSHARLGNEVTSELLAAIDEAASYYPEFARIHPKVD